MWEIKMSNSIEVVSMSHHSLENINMRNRTVITNKIITKDLRKKLSHSDA